MCYFTSFFAKYTINLEIINAFANICAHHTFKHHPCLSAVIKSKFIQDRRHMLFDGGLTYLQFIDNLFIQQTIGY